MGVVLMQVNVHSRHCAVIDCVYHSSSNRVKMIQDHVMEEDLVNLVSMFISKSPC